MFKGERRPGECPTRVYKMNLCEREETKLREVSGKFRVAKVNIQSPRRLSDGSGRYTPLAGQRRRRHRGTDSNKEGGSSTVYPDLARAGCGEPPRTLRRAVLRGEALDFDFCLSIATRFDKKHTRSCLASRRSDFGRGACDTRGQGRTSEPGNTQNKKIPSTWEEKKKMIEGGTT